MIIMGQWLGFVPVRRSKIWLIWFGLYGVVLSLSLWFNRFVVFGQEFDAVFAFRFVLLSFVLSLVVNGFGWLGARWIWLLTTIGILAGLVFMFVYVMRDMTGWEDLISFIAFGQAVLFGFMMGIVVEIVAVFWQRRRSK